MKSRRLTETDIANLAFKSPRDKRHRLIAIERPKPIKGSYEPFRRNCGDAVNERAGLFVTSQPATPLSELEKSVAKACKADRTLLDMNLRVAKQTHRYAMENLVEARREQVRPLTLPFGQSYDFSMDLLMFYKTGEICAVFPDLRRTGALSSKAQDFVFSMMHHRWRESYPDLAEIKVEIWRYLNNDSRTIRPVRCDDENLISYDALMNDVHQTFSIWHDVLRDSSHERRNHSRDIGGLFGT